jgi:hypothetical protein
MVHSGLTYRVDFMNRETLETQLKASFGIDCRIRADARRIVVWHLKSEPFLDWQRGRDSKI